MFARRGRFVGFVLLVAVAGCGGGSASAPRTLPPLPSATSTTQALADAPQSKHDELAAATHVVREYFRLLNAPTTIANARRLSKLMSPGCSCRRVAKSTLQVARRHETYFGRSKIVGITPTADSATAVEILVQYNYTDGGIRRADGSIAARSPGKSGVVVNLTVRLIDGRWLILRSAVVREGRGK